MAKAELLFVGTDTGLLQYSNPGGIGRWLRSGHSLPGSDIVAIWAHPDDPTQLLCSDGEQIYESADGGQHWSDPIELAITAFIAASRSPERILARTDSDAILSTDSGENWRRIAPADRIAAANDILTLSTTLRAHTSIDGGASWQSDEPWLQRAASHDGAHIVGVSLSGVWTINGTAIQPAPISARVIAVCSDTAPRIVCSDGRTLWAYEADWQCIADAPELTLLTNTAYHPDRLWGADKAGTLWYSANRGVTWEAMKTHLGTINAIVVARLR
jgi:photosystem II stability/assembly factor-like uncharacterized protein